MIFAAVEDKIYCWMSEEGEEGEVKELKVRTSGLLENGGPRVDRCITQTIVRAEVYNLSE